jgi:hypothetical protein
MWIRVLVVVSSALRSCLAALGILYNHEHPPRGNVPELARCREASEAMPSHSSWRRRRRTWATRRGPRARRGLTDPWRTAPMRRTSQTSPTSRRKRLSLLLVVVLSLVMLEETQRPRRWQTGGLRGEQHSRTCWACCSFICVGRGGVYAQAGTPAACDLHSHCHTCRVPQCHARFVGHSTSGSVLCHPSHSTYATHRSHGFRF